MDKDFAVYKDQIIDSIIKVCAIESVPQKKAGSSSAPFGEGIAKCLDAVLDLASSLGFDTFNGNGYYGYARTGSGKEMLGILGHVDVVPTGDPKEWITPPFMPTMRDGKIYARGTIDDKAPMLIALYALKSLMGNGFVPSKEIRIIWGTSEETTWQCIAKYKEEQRHPDISFSPDGDFPVVFAEKGIIRIDAVAEKCADFNIIGGIAFNVVPDEAVYIGPDINCLERELRKCSYEYVEADSSSLTVLGKTAHASLPETGINAILRLCKCLYNIGKKSPVINFLAERFDRDVPDSSIFGKYKDETGVLTITPSVISVNDTKQSFSLDVRIPASFTFERLKKEISDLLSSYELTYSTTKEEKAVYVPKDSFLIKTLLESYKKYTGENNAQPIAMGGGTYAKAFKNCVSFGPNFPKEEDMAHKPNEYINIANIEKLFYIYRDAIIELSK